MYVCENVMISREACTAEERVPRPVPIPDMIRRGNSFSIGETQNPLLLFSYTASPDFFAGEIIPSRSSTEEMHFIPNQRTFVIGSKLRRCRFGHFVF